MRYALLLALCALSCAAEPVLLPDASPPADAGPCGGACGAGTVCSGGACVAVNAGSPVDAGALDAGTVDSGAVDVGEDRPGVDAGSDVGVDAVVLDAVPDAVDVMWAPDAPTPPCFAPEALCSGSCARLDIDPRHCGRCGNACPTAPNTVPLCTAGACGFRCATGFTDCDGMAANGCEARLHASDPNNCGGCGRTCPGTGQRCVVDQCANICGPTVTYCGGSCVDVTTDIRHCGGCGNVCPTGVSGTVACVAGTCVLTCDTTHADCNASASDGCETSIGTRTDCGGCGIACAGSLGCANVGTGSAPVLRCGCTNTALSACGTSCVDLARNHDHCGACGNNCGDHGFCNNAGACLSCGNSPEGVARTWCGTACTDLTSDDQNCGACGNRCTGGRYCGNGVCRG